MSFLIIGTGQRVEKLIIPSLIILGKKFYITGRNKKRLDFLLNKFKLKKENIIDFKNLKNKKTEIQKIILSVKSQAYFEIYKYLLIIFHSKNIKIYIETPILPSLKNLIFFKKSQFKFAAIEDSYHIPILQIINKLDKNNKFISKIIFYQSGYYYHAISQIKKIYKNNFNSANLTKILNAKCSKFNFDNFFVYITNKRNYHDCFTIYEFDKFVIIDNQFNLTNKIPIYNKKKYYIKRVFVKGVINSFNLLDDQNYLIYKYEINVSDIHLNYFNNLDYINQQSLLSIINIFNENEKYELIEHLYDLLSFKILIRIKYFNIFFIKNFFTKIFINI